MSPDFYHVCFAVPDLELACSELTTAAEVAWRPARGGRLAEWPYRITFSTGPPYIEIIEGAPGSPWDVSQTGARFDHIGWWTHSLSESVSRLADAGFPSEFSGCPWGRSFGYHRLPGIGARIEVVDVDAQAAFLRTWDPDGMPGRALECRTIP